MNIIYQCVPSTMDYTKEIYSAIALNEISEGLHDLNKRLKVEYGTSGYIPLTTTTTTTTNRSSNSASVQFSKRYSNKNNGSRDDNGYGRALHSFSLITSLSPNNINNNNNNSTNSINNSTNNNNNKQTNNVNRNSSRNSNNNNSIHSFNNNNSSSLDSRQHFESRSIVKSPTTVISESSSSPINSLTTTKDNSGNICYEKVNLVDFIRCLGEGLAQCHNLKQLDLSIPLDSEQLNLITSNCPRLTELNINSFLIGDKGIESALNPLNNLEQLSVVSNVHANQEFVKQTGRQIITLSPLSLYSISTLKRLKSLKFSLLPQFGNKALIESGIVSEQTDSSEHHQADIERAVKSLSNCKLLENLELMSCNINEFTLQWLLEQYNHLNRLVIYRNSSLSTFDFRPSTITHLSLSCLSMLQTIHIESKTLRELYIEGCESLKSTELITPMLSILSMEGCSGSLKLSHAFNIKTLSLFECPDLSQRDLENTLDSLISLEELKLDIEAWTGIRSCMMDCPELEEFKASESSLESLYLKADHMQNIELDFCDQLRSAVIDILTCRLFSFTQSHPTHSGVGSGNTSFAGQLLTNNNSSSNDDINDDEDQPTADDDDRKYLAPMVLFLQAHHFIKDCIILSGNLLGKLSTRTVGHLSIEQRSFTSYIFNVDKICKLNTYHQTEGDESGNRTPRFIPIEPMVRESTNYFSGNTIINSNNNNNNDYESSCSGSVPPPPPPPPRRNSPTRTTTSSRPHSPSSRSPSPSSQFSFPTMCETYDETNWQPTYPYLSPVSPSLSFNNRNSKRYGQK
ncbi:hypothetical protein PPL_10068 [Heterostelium album PN500]|uniref:Uncharacterized protein n=1 Tax=Heterostelium pallidum (strain ATCC 26659 / Pp 5 / PN500) TaxID=670386 RepID=D3BQ85_HETP5|nr:hypothetical protein PPL_10068 [Heterostelium album PN500]EFA76305.1 hypothetical protein PPL_10068 [Heterostelium album PN500]|eukprot:XP_020428437.1 hypothetical protein PPL_10068 [Heterostelium album PN500]